MKPFKVYLRITGPVLVVIIYVLMNNMALMYLDDRPSLMLISTSMFSQEIDFEIVLTTAWILKILLVASLGLCLLLINRVKGDIEQLDYEDPDVRIALVGGGLLLLVVATPVTTIVLFNITFINVGIMDLSKHLGKNTTADLVTLASFVLTMLLGLVIFATKKPSSNGKRSKDKSASR